MLDFDTYVAHLGEAAIQAIIERMERYEGKHSLTAAPLEERWRAVMQGPVAHSSFLAA